MLLQGTAEKHAEMTLGCIITMFPYTVQSVPQYLGKHDIYMVPNPSKHPDLNPCDCFLFSEPKLQHEGEKLQRHHWKHT